MFNIMLDEYPTEWEGYPINTDFRVGIQITQASVDTELNSIEKIQVFALLLFKDKTPNAEGIAECVDWFLNGWYRDHPTTTESRTPLMDFDVDAGRIYSAFLSQYQIDLNIEDMHYWRFMYLLSNLEECAFTRIVDIRAREMNDKMSKEERAQLQKAKKIYTLVVADEAEQEATDNFLKALNGDK